MSSPPQYEFDSKQKEVIQRLSRSMQWVGAPLQVVGILFALGGIVQLVQAFREKGYALGAINTFLGALWFIVLGSWTRNAARSFHRIVTTTGQDIDHLMDGLDNLGKMYSLLSYLVKSYIAVIVLVLVIVVVVAIAAAVRT